MLRSLGSTEVKPQELALRQAEEAWMTCLLSASISAQTGLCLPASQPLPSPKPNVATAHARSSGASPSSTLPRPLSLAYPGHSRLHLHGAARERALAAFLRDGAEGWTMRECDGASRTLLMGCRGKPASQLPERREAWHLCERAVRADRVCTDGVERAE